MAELKTKPTAKSVTAFLNTITDPARRADCFEIVKMMEDASGDKPTMWGPSIVGFGRYTYKGASGETEWMRIGFSPRKSDLTLYLMTGANAFPELMSKLGKFKTSKACLYIKKLADVDRRVLRDIIKKSLKQIPKA
jgi:Domain of unknown function (DU1801)